MPDPLKVQLRLWDAVGNCVEAKHSVREIASADGPDSRWSNAGYSVVGQVMDYLSARVDRRLNRLRERLAEESEREAAHAE